jgi:hypothetical protein
MKTLDYLVKKFKIDVKTTSPIEIANVGRDNLADWLHELNFKTGVEVGVAAGAYSEIICKANPQMTIYGVDAWKPYKGYSDYTQKRTLNKLYREAQSRLKNYPNYKLIKKFSLEALPRFKNNSLDFVYIDANHQDPFVTQDITRWYKKVKPGGILAGHDYVFSRAVSFDVVTAIKRFTTSQNLEPWFVLGTWKRLPGIVRDDSRTWLLVKK